MSTDLPLVKPFVRHSATLATSQSGAPFAAGGHDCHPVTVLESGSRATVPAASPTPLAISPAAVLAPPTASPAPRIPAPTLEIDWSMKRPIEPIVSPGLGRRGSGGAEGDCGAACAGASGGAVITAGGSAGGVPDGCAAANDARLASARANGKVLRIGTIMAERGLRRYRRAPGSWRK